MSKSINCIYFNYNEQDKYNRLFSTYRKGNIANGVFASHPNNKFLEKVIEEFINNIKHFENKVYDKPSLFNFWGTYLFGRVYWAFELFNKIPPAVPADFSKYTYSIFEDKPHKYSNKHREIIGIKKRKGKVFKENFKELFL